MYRQLVLAASVACSGAKNPDPSDPGDTDTDADSDTDSDSDADTDTDAGVASATCVLQPDNALRFDCDITTTQPDEVRVRLLDGTTELGVFASTEVATEHRVVLWGMTPSSTYAFEAWAIGSPEDVVPGELVTGALPAPVDVVLEVDDPGPHDTEFVLFDFKCGAAGAPEGLILSRDDGQVIWYQLPDGLSDVNDDFEGFSVSPEGTILANLERNQLYEWDLAGNVLMDMSLARGELLNLVHHDVERRDGLTYVLTAHGVVYPDDQIYAMDGFDVIDGSNGVIASWSTEGFLDPTLSGPATSPYWDAQIGEHSDWAHGNALALGPTGEVYVSLRFVNAIIEVAGDPADPGFGTVSWMLLGEETPEPYSSDFTLVSTGGVTPVDFGDQHHVSMHASGDLMVWDNRAASQTNTRALRIHVDEATSTADLVEDWDSGNWCPGRGSAFVLPNGAVLADCSSDDYLILEIEPQTNAVLWSMHPTCRSGLVPLNQVYRAIPFDPYPHE